MSRGMWKAVEAKAREVRMTETERESAEEGRRDEIQSKRGKKKEKTKERKKDGSKKSSKRVEDLGQGIRSRKADTRKVLQVNLCF